MTIFKQRTDLYQSYLLNDTVDFGVGMDIT